MSLSKKRISLFLTGALVAGQLRAAGTNETLEFFQQEARVVTASRYAQPVSEAPVAVEVITADDIHRSGAVNIWDVMRFRAGLDVLDARSGEGNRAIVTMRGFPQEFVDKLLVLVDGQSVYTGLSGGAVWEHIPVQLQDIDRIEIARGPNAALYGSNAGLGVINIITRKASLPNTLGLSAITGTNGLTQQAVSYENGGDRGGYRISADHKEQNAMPSVGGGNVNDYLNASKLNFRSDWNSGAGTTLGFNAGMSHQMTGVIDPNFRTSGHFLQHFQKLSLSHEVGRNSSVQAMFARRDDQRVFDPVFGGRSVVREYQYDGELLHDIHSESERFRTVYGTGLRYARLEGNEIFKGKDHQKNALFRGFVSQSWQVSHPVNLVGAASLERSDTGGTEDAYQFAAVISPREEHAFRLSYALAPTIPTMYKKQSNQQTASAVVLVGNPDLQAERLTSYEAGYQASLLEHRLAIETNVFYMDAKNLARTVVESFTFNPDPLLTLSFDDDNRAIARGAESKWSYRWDRTSSCYANYTFESISDRKRDVNVDRGTPKHKVNLGTVLGVRRDLSLTLNAGYKDGYSIFAQATGQTVDVHPYWRLDARVGYLPRPSLEIFVSGQNLADRRHVEFGDGLEIPRTFLAGFSLKLGTGN